MKTCQKLAQFERSIIMAKKFSMSDLLNGQSIGTGAASNGQPFIVQQIPLEQIQPSDKNKYGIRDIEELAMAIEAVGLMHNIVVRETGDPDTYELISGERRYRAFQLLREGGNEEYATIPCKVEVQEDDELSELGLLFANSTAREHNDFEKTYQAMRIKEILQSLKAKGHKFKGRLRDIVADMLDVSGSQVSRMEKIHGNLIPGFMEEFKEEGIGISTAYDLSLLPKDEQAQVLEEYKETGAEAIQQATAKLYPAKQTAKPPVDPAAPVTEKSPPAPIATQPQPPVEYEQPTADMIQANDAQRSVLLDFGKEAVREFCLTDNHEQQVRIAERIEAYMNVAVAFGLHDFEEEIHTIPEYKSKYGVNAEQGL
jgi:ParB family chromosome partitioning protein